MTALQQDDKVRALALFLEIPYSSAECELENYAVYTENEAYEIAREHIDEVLWSFNQSFLCEHSNIISLIDGSHWQLMMEEQCEEANNLVREILIKEGNYNTFIKSAINIDGLGQFLNSYDGYHGESNDFTKANLDDNYIIVRIA